MTLTQISTAGVKDDAVTAGKIPANAVGSSELADQSVSLAKLPHGDGSSDGKFLRANNGADPTFETVNTNLVADTSPQLGGNLDCQTNNITLNDSSNAASGRIRWGDNSDLQIYHDGTHSYIQNNTGALYNFANTFIVNNYDNSENFIRAFNNGAVELYYDGSKKLNTESFGVDINGTLRADTLKLAADNQKLEIGGSSDLQIYHDGSHSRINGSGTGKLILMGSEINLNNSDSSEYCLRTLENGAVELYHNNVKKFETHDVGTIFTEAGSGTTQAAIKVNTTLDSHGSITVRDKRNVANSVSAFQVENASNGSNETNLLLRSVNLASSEFAHGIYAAKSHRFAVSSNTTPTVQIDSDGLKFNNDQASNNALNDYEEGSWTPTVVNGGFSIGNNHYSKYVKIGGLVFVQFYFTLSGSGSGHLRIGGLPFTNPSNSYSAGISDIGQGGVKGAYHRVESNSSQFEYFYSSENSSNTRIPLNANQVGAAYLIGSLTYFTTA